MSDFMADLQYVNHEFGKLLRLIFPHSSIGVGLISVKQLSNTVTE